MTIRIAVLAQDLIWQDRLARAVESAGATPMRAKTAPEFDRALACADFAIIDLTAHGYDPLAAIERARSLDARVLAVGPHDDLDLRKRALARGRRAGTRVSQALRGWSGDHRDVAGTSRDSRQSLVTTEATRPTIPRSATPIACYAQPRRPRPTDSTRCSSRSDRTCAT